MPSDIRSFFGGQPSGTSSPKPAEAEKKKARGRAKKIVEDDEDEDPGSKTSATPKRAGTKKTGYPEAPVVMETTADDFFSNDSKPKRSEPVRPKTRRKPKDEEEVATPKKKATPAKGKSEANGTPNGRSSGRKRKDVGYAELDENAFPDDDTKDADDEFKAAVKVGRRMGDDYVKEDDEDDDKPLVPQRKETTGKQQKLNGHERDDDDVDGDVTMKDTKADDDFVVPDDDEEIVEDRPAKKAPARRSKKRKSTALDDGDDHNLDIEHVKPTKKAKASPAKKSLPAAKKAKKDEPQDSAEIKAIFDSIPTIDAPAPPDKSGNEDGEKKKFQYGQHSNSAVPAGAIDSADLPNGQENCLAGLSFVFTGQLQRLGREQGQNLVKQYGGKVTTAPSKKTSYVVLGEDAGPKKLEVIKKNGLKVINEDGLFELIRRLPANGGDSAAAEKMAEKRGKEEEMIRQAAAEMEKQERANVTKPKPQSSGSGASSAAASQAKGKESAQGPDTRLWTVRYAPKDLNHICGNKGQVDKLARWLRAFPKNQRTKFKLPGPDGSGVHRAMIIHGPPGIGKTTAAHLVAKLEGYDIVESNASDTRSKKLVETGLKGVLSTTSLMGYFGQGSSDAEASRKKIVLIMDEVDGMSAGDRGGVGALAAVCKKSQIPMILICNDRKLPKMNPFNFVTYDLPFRCPTTDQIRARIMTIAFREGLKIPPNVINALIEGSGADIRQVVNMISTAKLDSEASGSNLSFEEGKSMSKAWEKHIILKPWDIVGKILGGGLFNAASKTTLNEKQELYFNDHEFAPLMLQENYLGTNPARANQFNGKPKKRALAVLDLVSKAADSISDGDLVDRMIHGSQQQWSLMPTHAIFSFVRPASFIHGSMAGNGRNRFTTWLGKNSNQGKLMRMVKEIQGHMRLRTSGDRHEIRQTYLPLLFERLVRRLQVEGKEAVPEIIELMDSYYLTKEDWDAILELGVGEADMEKVKIETQAKSTLTRLYNQQSHPLPFIKSSQVLQPKAAAKVRPDLEEALEESGDEAIDEAEVKVEDEDGEVDLLKDKYVAKPKKKKAAATAAGSAKGKAKAGGSRKRKKVDVDEADEEDEEDEEEVKPAKKGGKGKGRAKQ